MVVADNKELHLHLRQFAISNLKNTVQANWAAKPNAPAISELDKDIVRKSILDAICRAADNRSLCRIYKQIIYSIA